MQLFRKLSGNIFFKILLAFVALSFVLFGISGFILGGSSSWVVKVGNTTVGYDSLLKEMQNDRELILASNKSEEVLKYLDSDQFKSDALGRLVNKVMIKKLHDDFGVSASKKLIMEAIAKDPSFKKNGKFDHGMFKNFLAKHGLNEEKYINAIADEITATMIIQSFSLAAPTNHNLVLETENFRQEKRSADVALISLKDVGNIGSASEEEVKKFFEENKQKYALPEMRKISYLHFSRQDFAKNMQISDQEILAEYEKNKEQLQKPESRDFYHVLFEKEERAKEFLQKFESAIANDKTKAKAEFAKLAKEFTKKDVPAITLKQITKKDFIPELSDTTFKLGLNEHSSVLTSPLGFHIFLTTGVKPAQTMPFAEVKESLKQKMLQGREEKVLQAKIAEIDDTLLTSNSLSEVAKKFGLKLSTAPIKIDHLGQNEKGEPLSEIKGMADFAKNAFALQKGQTSKIFYAQNSEGFYAIKVEEIEPAHERELSQVKSQILEDLSKSRRYHALQDLAKKIESEVKKNPDQLAQIAAKYKLKFEKNREFPRVFYIDFQGQKMPYQSKFLDELFDVKIGQSTSAVPGGSQEFMIGVLREIKKASVSGAQFEQAKRAEIENFRSETLQEFNAFLLKENPVEVNEKILGAKEEK